MSQWDDVQVPAGYRPQYRSRGEREIADCLTRHRIPFIYEKPTAVMDRGLLRLMYPDFALRYGLLIEYFGRDDRGYMEQAKHKLQVYHENQYDVIPLYPPDLTGNWEGNLVDRIGYSLERRLTDYRERIK